MSGRSLRRLGGVVAAGVLVTTACSSSTSSDGGATLPVPGAGPTSDAPPGSADPTEPSTRPDTAPPVDPSTSPAPSAAPTTPPDSTPPDSASPDSTPPDTAPPGTSAPTGGVAVVYGGGRFDVPWAPLGWWDGSAWRNAVYAIDGTWVGAPDPTVPGLAATSLDLPDGAGQVLTGLTAGPEDFYCVHDERGPTIDLGTPLPETQLSIGFDAVAVTADWPLQPRPVRQIGSEVPVYREVGAELMADLVDTAPEGEVVQVVRVDLDADGDEEVLVAYERRLRPELGGAGDFTSVYVRVPAADGTVDDRLVTAFVGEDPEEMEFPFPTPGRMTVAAVADLNGDGVMEVALRDLFWEYGGVTVFEFVDGELEPVMSGGCGV